jgi:hypothetical protein
VQGPRGRGWYEEERGGWRRGWRGGQEEKEEGRRGKMELVDEIAGSRI